MMERAIFLADAATSMRSAELGSLLQRGDIEGARQRSRAERASGRGRGRRRSRAFRPRPDAVGEAMASAKARQRIDLERNLGVLGTLGNNAPFIGLFGTVLGIIKAFPTFRATRRGGAGRGHGRHLRGAGRHRGRPDGRHPGGRRLQLLQGPAAQDDGARRRVAHLVLAPISGARRRAAGRGPRRAREAKSSAWPAAASSTRTTTPDG